MKLYRVCGTTTVTVYKEVWANDRDEAIDRASNELTGLTEYCGNGGYDKLIGVEGDDESVSADGYIEWDDIEELENDPDHRECPKCHEELDEVKGDNGKTYWECPECDTCYDEDYEEVDPDDYFDDEDDEE